MSRMVGRQDSVGWIRPSGVAELEVLDRWAQAVGPPLIQTPAPSPGGKLHELTFAVWNTNVGAGDLDAFVTDLKRGALTFGQPVKDFVLLLQEVHRSGPDVPGVSPSAAGAARIEGLPPKGPRLGIDAYAERARLALFYVPSMRNGVFSEDRGNAILSTLPLSALRAFELPFERERRVAVAASVQFVSGSGFAESLSLVNVHLDPRSAGWRLHRSLGAGRERQAKWLLRVLDEKVPTLLAGDFNTWVRGENEHAISHIKSRFAAPATDGGTLAVSRFFPSLRLDHAFFRLPKEWRFECHVAERAYGSDHHAIVGRVHVE